MSADDDTRLKNLIRDIRSSMNETRDFWTKLPYDLCKDEDSDVTSRSRGGHSRSRYGRQPQYSDSKCWNGHDAGRYTNAIVSDGNEFLIFYG